MKGLFYISILTFSLLSCQTSTADDSVDETDAKVIGQIYVNEYGQVELNQLNDTLWQTVFTNNEGHVFDTSLAIDNSGGYLRFRARGGSMNSSPFRFTHRHPQNL